MPAVTPPFLGLIFGIGAPTVKKPAGTLYSRQDTDALYASLVAAIAPPVVQHEQVFTNGGTASVTFTNPVTAGNLLLCTFSGGLSVGTIANGWTVLDQSSNDAISAYRYALAGDGVAPPALLSSVTGNWAMSMVELGSVTGDVTKDIIAHNLGANTSTFNSPTITSTGTNQLLFLTAIAADATADFSAVSGLTALDSGHSAGFGAQWDGTLLSTGAAQNLGGKSIVRPTGSVGNNFVAQVLVAGAAQSWVLIAPGAGATPNVTFNNNPPAVGNFVNTTANGLMSGQGSAFFITPASSGIVEFSLTAWGLNGTAAKSVFGIPYYGTGVAPVDGAAIPGGATAITANPLVGTSSVATAAFTMGFSVIVSGLTVGTHYWFDLAKWADAGTGGLHVEAGFVKEL